MEFTGLMTWGKGAFIDWHRDDQRDYLSCVVDFPASSFPSLFLSSLLSPARPALAQSCLSAELSFRSRVCLHAAPRIRRQRHVSAVVYLDEADRDFGERALSRRVACRPLLACAPLLF